MKKVKGFTLIELLIVVAIIGILAAIAIPNFLAAQTRSKVARAEAEHRQLATALETYYIDNNVYPPAGNWAAPGGQPFDTYGALMDVPYNITTPVAHLTSLPTDPFRDNNTKSYMYGANAPNGLTCWMLTSYGPDNTKTGTIETPYLSDGTVPGSCDPSVRADRINPVNIYDPTNGTTSVGEIYRTGP
ncbi:MAG TPA: type II secretion system protein [bacterium]|nr:type II secretion system protein [bacterium]